MYILRQALINLSILSLQTGQVIGMTTELLIDDAGLGVMGYWCQPIERNAKPQILLQRDVRQLGREGIIVNDADVMSEPEDLVRLQAVIERKLVLIGLHVITESGAKIGRIENYSVNMDQAQIQKLYIKPNFLKSFLQSSLTIDRTQVVDVQPKRVIVRDATIKSKASILAPKPKTLQS